MAKIKSDKEFKARIDEAFETQKTRDEAKNCYELERIELKEAEVALCEYAVLHPEVFDGNDDTSAWGTTEKVKYTLNSGKSIERADGGKLTEADFLDAIPKRYIRVKRELNKAKLKADGLDAAALSALGLVSVLTHTLKLVARNNN